MYIFAHTLVLFTWFIWSIFTCLFHFKCLLLTMAGNGWDTKGLKIRFWWSGAFENFIWEEEKCTHYSVDRLMRRSRSQCHFSPAWYILSTQAVLLYFSICLHIHVFSMLLLCKLLFFHFFFHAFLDWTNVYAFKTPKQWIWTEVNYQWISYPMMIDQAYKCKKHW